MVLSQYLFILRNLIQSPTSPVPLLPDSQLVIYLNLARAQVALDAECVRASGTATVGAGTVVVPITTLVPELGGVSQAIVVRNALLNDSRVDIRPWDWFANYYLAGPPASLTPAAVMAHQGQGSFSTLYFSSASGGALNADLVLLPDDLGSDSDPDAIPYPWVDAVSFYAAWYSYMSLQRQADADHFFLRYNLVLRRGRSIVTSTALPENEPGGLGAQIATTKTPLGIPPPAPQGRGR